MNQDSSSRITDQTLVFLDVETTGLYPNRGDRIIEIALARARNGAIGDTYATLVHPDRRISPDASRVNGIYDEDVAEAPRFAAIADEVNDFLRDGIIICHNAPFDLGFVSSEMERTGKKISAPRVLDTLLIARANYRFDSNGLQNLARVMRIPTPQAHRALSDVLTTQGIFNWFVADLKIKTLEELVQAQGGRKKLNGLPPTLEEALARGTRLKIEYVDMNGSRSERWVTPRQVVQRDVLYLIAFCHLREAERNFRLDRIVTMEIEKM
jgi:DNA polymerase-3 subunit epsilon